MKDVHALWFLESDLTDVFFLQSLILGGWVGAGGAVGFVVLDLFHPYLKFHFEDGVWLHQLADFVVCHKRNLRLELSSHQLGLSFYGFFEIGLFHEAFATSCGTFGISATLVFLEIRVVSHDISVGNGTTNGQESVSDSLFGHVFKFAKLCALQIYYTSAVNFK